VLLAKATAGAPDSVDLFGFVQLEFGFLLGPPDGRYLVRSSADGPAEAVLVLSTLAAPERRRLRGRRPRPVGDAQPEPVPTARATVVRPEPFRSREEAGTWVVAVRGDADAAEAELTTALAVLNRALRAHRVAAADPYAGDVSVERALVARLGFGPGEAVAEGRFAEAIELPRRGGRRVKRSMEAPEERFAALVAGRERALAAEELVLRARADFEAGRFREAALQTRVALEALIAELDARAAGALGEHRGSVSEAANAALRGELPDGLAAGLAAALAAMEAALRRHRLAG
jgi:hypothetical protein